MGPASLDDFIAWNDQLAALVQAGVPIDTGLGVTRADTAATLQQINAVVATRVSQGATLANALARDQGDVPQAYGSLVQLCLSSGDFATAVADNARLTESVEQVRYASRSSLLYPLIVCCLAYIGLIGLSLVLVPGLESIYRDMKMDIEVAPHWMRVLHEVRAALPYWAPVFPLLLLGWMCWRLWRRRQPADSWVRSSRSRARLPGLSQTITLERWANFADGLAALLDRGAPLDESLILASGAWGDAHMQADARALAESLKGGTILSDTSPTALRFPPFLRWAIWQAEPTTGRVSALRMAADMYAAAARRNTEHYRVAYPLIACAVVGGTATLIYALALFLPIVELVKFMATITPV